MCCSRPRDEASPNSKRVPAKSLGIARCRGFLLGKALTPVNHSQPHPSTVWAMVFPLSQPSFDPLFVRPNSIPWLLLETRGVQEGPTGGDLLTRTTFIQRVNTSGGLAPATGCSQASDVGKKAFIPYTADYFFFTDATTIDD
jgi:hypothetical protein